MPAFQHYALVSEAFEILRELLQQELVAIPEQPILVEPTLARYEAYEPALAESLQRYRCVLLEGPFTKHALEFGCRDGGTAAGTYYADQTSGPRIRWCLPGLDTTNQPTLFPGAIGYQSSYRDPTTNRWAPASEEVKGAYKAIIGTFKRHLVRVPWSSGERLWIGRRAKHEIEQGHVFLER